MTTSSPSAEELRDAVDEVAIRALIAVYGDVVNRRTWAEFDDLFVATAPIKIDLRDRALMTYTGPTEMAEFIGRSLDRYLFFEFVAMNVRVGLRADGDPDRATVRTYMCEVRQDHEGTPGRAFGVYSDKVVRTPDGWRFEARAYQSMGRGEYGLDLMPTPEFPG